MTWPFHLLSLSGQNKALSGGRRQEQQKQATCKAGGGGRPLRSPALQALGPGEMAPRVAMTTTPRGRDEAVQVVPRGRIGSGDESLGTPVPTGLGASGTPAVLRVPTEGTCQQMPQEKFGILQRGDLSETQSKGYINSRPHTAKSE